MEVTVIDVIKQMFVAFPSILVGTQTITAAIHGIFNIENKNVNHAVSWIIGTLAGLGFIAFNGLTFGLPAWADYAMGAITGLTAGGCANGWYDWPAIEKVFDAITALFSKDEKK